MREQTLTFLDSIISAAEKEIAVSSDPKRKKRNHFVIGQCKKLKVTLNTEIDFLKFLTTKIRNLLVAQTKMEAIRDDSRESKQGLLKNKLHVDILLMIHERLFPLIDEHEYPIGKLFDRVNRARIEFVETTNIYIDHLQFMIAREYGLQLFFTENTPLRSSQKRVKHLHELLILLLNNANDDPEQVTMEVIQNVKVYVAKKMKEKHVRPVAQAFKAYAIHLKTLEKLPLPTPPRLDPAPDPEVVPAPYIEVIKGEERSCTNCGRDLSYENPIKAFSPYFNTFRVCAGQLSKEDTLYELFPKLSFLKTCSSKKR